MKWKPSLRISDESGFTLMELLVASGLGLMVVALSLSTVISNRNTYKKDIVSTRINQNLRSAIDIMGMNIRQAGEALPKYFPAVELINGGELGDTLIVRRNLLENEILNVCQELIKGSTNTEVRFSFDTIDKECAYSAEVKNYQIKWQEEFNEESVGKPFVYNRSTRKGEFFNGTGTKQSGETLSIVKDGSVWENYYPGDGRSAALYFLEEYKFQLNGEFLQIVKNGEEEEPLNIIDKVDYFDVSIKLNDGSIRKSFGSDEDWTAIDYIEVTLKGIDHFSGEAVKGESTVRFFPRNIMSF